MARFSLCIVAHAIRSKDVDLMILIGYNLSNRTGFAMHQTLGVYRDMAAREWARRACTICVRPCPKANPA